MFKLRLFAVAENYGVQPGDGSDKNHAVASAKEGCYVGISRDTMAFKPLSASLSLALLLGCISIVARDVILEFKGAYFHPTNDCFKDIYGKSAGIYGPELTVQLCNDSNWYGFASVDYLTKSGRSVGLCDKTKVSLLPIAVGLKYFAFSSCNDVADIYFGAGVQPVRVHTKDCSAYVPQNQTRWGVGGIFKVGSYIYAPCNFVFDVFLDYSYARAKGKVACSSTQNVIPLKANVSGVIFGVGLGYCF